MKATRLLPAMKPMGSDSTMPIGSRFGGPDAATVAAYDAVASATGGGT